VFDVFVVDGIIICREGDCPADIANSERDGSDCADQLGWADGLGNDAGGDYDGADA
jgi:hypothetical protein